MALRDATLLGIILVFSGHIFSSTGFTGRHECKTYGSGIFYTFNKTAFHLKSTCPVTLTRFTHAGVDCHIIVRRGSNGLMNRVEIIVNKITTLVHNNTVTVEGSSISLPYDHTYQHVFHYGIYTRLQSKLLPLSVTWNNVSDGVSSVWVQLDQSLVEGMSGLCGYQNSTETMQQLISTSVLSDGQCLTQNSVKKTNTVCLQVFSYALDCLGTKYATYLNLCHINMNGLLHKEANCSFFKEISVLCGSSSPLWTVWRSKSNCPQPFCPGDLRYAELGPAFPPTCSNPQNYTSELTSTCLPAEGKVLNDQVGYHSINVKECPCVHGKIIYAPGQERRTKCQTCICINGKWACSANTCPAKCIIEGQFITTFDGKQYSVLDRCTFVAARGLNWTLNIQYSTQNVVIEKAYLNIHQEKYTFSANRIEVNNREISDLSQTESATVFWQSSMFVQVQTSFGLKMQVQIIPEIQIYLNLPPTENTKGLCGTFNNDTSDDFTTFSGIIESSVQLFAQSWSMGSCTKITGCINTDNEIFAEDNCDQLTDPEGVFAVCHDFVPVSPFVEACVKRTCQCSAALQECLCVSFGNYAKACTTQGITVKDWRSGTNCPLSCMGNLRFAYDTSACNHTCRSLSGPDPTCEVVDDPVEGCGCTSDSHLSNQQTCSTRTLCSCHHPGGVAPPGPVVIGGRQCLCENGQLHCPKICNCTVGKICVDCLEIPVITAHRTCESLTKPVSDDKSCISGCYCPDGLLEDHNGGCVTHDNCTCEFSGRVYETGQSVETNCKICTCRGGEWSCVDEACPGVCEVFGNGQYRTFDSKWYRFDGHCQYTLVKDATSSGQFAIKTESVPCCDESLTCSRAISVELLGAVTLMMSDMNVIERAPAKDALLAEPLYSIHTVGLYIIISVPRLGITIIWDKHTRVTIQLEHWWRGQVVGLCGNFDGKVTNDLLTSSSSEVSSVLDFGNSWKTAVPPCSDVTNEIFPCERHSYCAAWAQRRCMILSSDTFKDCHLKVDPEPYYQACVLESCSCEFEGKFLGFCTAVAAYAEVCSAKDVCINWRTPDLCPVYCDYYNEVGECTWHYNPCGAIKTCGTNYHFTGKLEGCYPRCPEETPYYDENTGKCKTLDNCTCKFMNRVLSPSEEMCTPYLCCKCLDGQIVCTSTSTSTTTTTIYYTSTTEPSTTTMTHTSTMQSPSTEKPKKLYTTPMTETTTSQQITTTGMTSESVEKTTTTEIPPLQSTKESTTQLPTTESTTEYTTTTQESTIESTTKYTTTTQESTTESTTESYATPLKETTSTKLTTSESTEEYTTTMRKSTTESTIESYTTEQTTITKPTTTESTDEYTTTITESTTESTTESYTTTTEQTTTTKPTTTESTDEYTTTITESSTESTTESYTTPTEQTTTTKPTTTESTEEYTTTFTESSTESTTESYTTPTEQTTTTKPTTTESTGEYTTTITESSTESTTESYTTPTEQTTTTKPTTTESTEEYTTTFRESTTESITELYTTPTEQTTTTKPTTTESTGEYTTTITESTTESTTESYTTSTEQTTTTKPTTSESTEEYTTTFRESTTESTTELYTTPTEQTTTTKPTTTENTGEYTTTITESTTESTTESYTTSTEQTTTTKPTTSESTEEYTTTMMKSTTENTTESNTTPAEQTTTTKPTTIESTDEYTTTFRESTTESTTELYTTPTEQTTTTKPSTTESTGEYTTTITESTTESTIESYTTSTEQTTTTKPTTTESTGEYTTTIRESTTKSTTESYTSPVEYTTTEVQYTTTTKPSTAGTTTEYTTTTQPPPTESTTESYTTPVEETTTTWLPPTETTTEFTTKTQPSTTKSTTEYEITTKPLKSESTTQPPTTPKEHTTTNHPTSVKFSTPVATESTRGIVTGPTITTPAPHSPQELNTTINPTTTPPSVCECKDVMRNKSWSCGESWREDCADKVCMAGVIEVKSISCPTSQTRTDCPRGMMSLVEDEETCCKAWECDCQCQVYGDPHYISFEGITFDFMDNCTYTLVEERELQHRLSITVDNYYCVPEIDNSCSRGITLKYWNDIVTLMVTEENMVESTLNQEIIKPPYEDQVFKFESSFDTVFINIKPIRSYVSLTRFNSLKINLAKEHFQNNTQGQCGVCGGQSCIRRNGVVEDDNCCDKTAYDWLVEDPLKPFCTSAPTNVPCIPTTPPSSFTPTKMPSSSTPKIPPAPPCIPAICDLLHHEAFAECVERIDLTYVEKNCQFDFCSYNSSVGACSSLEYAASECMRIGICVDWRYLTNGSCEIACPEGMIYDECRESPNDVCRGGVRVPATSVVGLRSGCFCPDDQMLAEEHKQVCVSECTKCKGPLGEPMPVGAVWESNCHVCTCNNQTKTEDCKPKPPGPTPVCSAYSFLVSDCCDNQICVEKNCEYNGQTYKVGDRWTDPSHPCESYSCSQTGIEVEKNICPLQKCAEDLRVWDEHHCCYTCNATCAARVTRMNLTVANCTQEVELPACEGQCETHNRWIQANGMLQLEQSHQCCKETLYEMREITMTCGKSSPSHFTYKHVTACECKVEG